LQRPLSIIGFTALTSNVERADIDGLSRYYNEGFR
jgi:hypothetical protein